MSGAKGAAAGAETPGFDPEAAGPGSVLSTEELDTVLSLLKEDATLEEIVGGFGSAFPAEEPTTVFRVGAALCLLLRDSLLTASQRMAARYVLATLYRDNPGELNPFLPFFITPLETTSSVALAEKRFTCDLLQSNPETLAVRTVTPLAALAEYQSRRGELKLPNLDQLWKAFRAKVPPVPIPLDLDIHGTLLEPTGPEADARRGYLAVTGEDELPSELRGSSEDDPEGDGDVGLLLAQEGAKLLPSAPPRPPPPGPPLLDAVAASPVRHLPSAAALPSLDRESEAAFARLPGMDVDAEEGEKREGMVEMGLGLRGFRPTFPRPPPPLAEFLDDEMILSGPLPMPPLLWDVGLGRDRGGEAKVRRLLERATRESLPMDAATELRSLLEASPKLVGSSGFAPDQLGPLVEHNSDIALNVFRALRQAGSPRLSAFLSQLVALDLNVRVMEVMNAVTRSDDVPPEIVQVYVSHCIATCNASDDGTTRNRLVRLVAVFLTSLVRAGKLPVQDMFVELSAFCVEFSSVKEANALYGLITPRTKE